MEVREMNRVLADILKEWDPFKQGGEFYETEIPDCLLAVRDCDDQEVLAREIQKIFEFTFEEELPMADCLLVAGKLLAVKNTGSCSI